MKIWFAKIVNIDNHICDPETFTILFAKDRKQLFKKIRIYVSGLSYYVDESVDDIIGLLESRNWHNFGSIMINICSEKI